jgi:periplasmic protein TonB
LEIASVIQTKSDAAADRPTNLIAPTNVWLSRFGVAVAASCILHGAAFAWILWPAVDTTLGAGGYQLESVSVEIISAAALESLSARPVPDSGGAIATVEQATGARAAADQTEISEQKRTSEPKQDVLQEAIVKIEPLPVPADVVAAEVVTPEPKPKEVEQTLAADEPRPEPKPDTPQRQAQAAVTAGGDASRAAAESIAADGSAGASAGQLTRYAIDVRLAIGRAKPRHNGGRGKVLVSFGLTESGGVRFVDIAGTSGSASLDSAAMRAIHLTPFPTPPMGMTDVQRTYVVPFEFK